MVTTLGVALAILVSVVLISYLIEAARRPPKVPVALRWAPAIPIRYVDVDGVRLRYVMAGDGPALVLLHTLRTQLDMFQNILPALAARYRVYALDYPGHGFSDIPRADYSAEFFVRTVGRALERLEIQDAVVLGESIGGSIALLLAARHDPRVRAVVAVNPYDYDRGRGLRRSSALANVLFALNEVPVLGATVNRLRQLPIAARVFQGGVHRPGAIPPALVREMYDVASRPGHGRAFMSLVHHWPTWESGRQEYERIDRPVLLIYGEHDWSRDVERQADARAIPGAELRIVSGAGHFLSMDAPDELLAALRTWPPLQGGAAGAQSSSAPAAGGGAPMNPRSR